MDPYKIPFMNKSVVNAPMTGEKKKKTIKMTNWVPSVNRLYCQNTNELI